MNSRIRSALTAGLIALVMVALCTFGIWARGKQNERYHECRMSHDQNYCMWHLK